MKVTKRQLKRIVEEYKAVSFPGHSIQKGNKMKISKRQLVNIIKEELNSQQLEEIDDAPKTGDHHWPRVHWSNIDDLTDLWVEMEEKSFDKGDPSMMPDDMSEKDARALWSAQVESAGMSLEAELTQRVRKAALTAMKEISDRLINGEFA